MYEHCQASGIAALHKCAVVAVDISSFSAPVSLPTDYSKVATCQAMGHFSADPQILFAIKCFWTLQFMMNRKIYDP